jgi:hypothetical protein
MSGEIPQLDPSGAYRRKAKAVRRTGKNKKCACGEARPDALVPRSNPTICYECERKSNGHKTDDNHHFAGKSNHWLTVAVPSNDHHAELSVAQYDWPKQTLENPDGCPLLAAAGCIRGFVDTVVYMIKKGVLWIAQMLECMHDWLVGQFGSKWWIGTPLEQFIPKQPS